MLGIPGRYLLPVLVLLTILAGHLGADYLADPATIPAPWRKIVAYVVAVVVFLAISTLTQLMYVLAVPVTLASTKRFLTLVGSLSATGAVLGTALGFRMGMQLFDDASRDPSRYGLAELLGTVSDGVTLMTLAMVGLCWPYAMRLGVEMTRAVLRPGQLRGLPQTTAVVIIVAGNYFGLNAAAFAYQLLTR